MAKQSKTLWKRICPLFRLFHFIFPAYTVIYFWGILYTLEQFCNLGLPLLETSKLFCHKYSPVLCKEMWRLAADEPISSWHCVELSDVTCTHGFCANGPQSEGQQGFHSLPCKLSKSAGMSGHRTNWPLFGWGKMCCMMQHIALEDNW